jgi:methylated-DNA-[protein]-cysteine S-methyltransferase
LSKNFKRFEIHTTWGGIAIELTGGNVTGCFLPYLSEAPENPFQIKRIQETEGPVSVVRFIEELFSGTQPKVPPLGERKGTEFQKLVWKGISEIPYGQTRSYGELAESIGRPKAVRAVGTACGKNPISLFVPCHRVTGSKGGLGGFSAGLPWKKFLLAVEG